MLFAKLKIRDSGAAVRTQGILSSLVDNDPKIQHIDIYFDYGSNCDDDLETEEELEHLAVAIGKSTALTSIYVCHRMTSGSCVLGLLDQLSRNNRHLSHLHLNCKTDELDVIREEFIRLLGRFLEENEALVELEVRHFQIYPSQGKNLLEALTCRSCALEMLKLENCKMEQTSVKEMMKFLQDHPEMSPRNISMEQNYIGDDVCFFISQLLGNKNIELKGIELGENPIGVSGFEHIANGLISRQHPLDKLSIGSNYFEECDRGMMTFLRAMSTNPDLIPKNLIFEGSYEISSNVMRELGMLLTNRTSQIELLQLYCYSIGDVQLTAFVNAIRESPDKVPETLDLTGTNIGQRGYFEIAELLRSPNCSLKKLETLDPDKYPDDDSIIRIVESLEENNILECLLVETGSISAHGWESLASLLCDWSSIHSTFTSNHTIFEFGSPTEMQPLNIRLFLTMNKNPDKKAVARMKVVGFHFARYFNIDSFLEMQPPLLTELLHCLNISFADLDEFFQQHDDLRHKNDNNPKNNLLSVHYMIMKINITMFDASRGRKL